MQKLSWNENPEITNLDTALVSLGFSYHIGEVPGIEGECYIIDNYTERKGGFFAIKIDNTHLKPVFELYRVYARYSSYYTNLDFLIKGLKSDMNFYGSYI